MRLIYKISRHMSFICIYRQYCWKKSSVVHLYLNFVSFIRQKNMDVTLKDNTAVGKSSSDEFSSSEHDEKKHEMMRHNIKISSFAQK